MGAHNFEHTIYTDSDMETAYRKAVEDARTEHGLDPYNGTISTTEGAVLSPLHTDNPTPEDQIDWNKISERLDHLDKWSHCEALPIFKVVAPQTERVGFFTVEVSVASGLLAGSPYDPHLLEALQAAFTKEIHKRIRNDGQLTMEPDYRGEVRTVTTGRTYKDYTASYWAHQILQAPKATTRATKGHTETRYFVIKAGEGSLPRWESGHPSQAEARAALPAALPASRGWDQSPTASYEVIAMTRRVGGEPLVTHSLDAASGKTTRVRVRGQVSEVIEPAQMTRQKGWVFYGWAAS